MDPGSAKESLRGEIAIPDDVSNESRALLLLQAAGLIEVDPEKGLLPTVNDIISNPKNLEFTVLAANQTVRAMTDVDASVVNNDMAADAGLVPTQDAIFLEPVADSSKPYYNVIASREDEADYAKKLCVIQHKEDDSDRQSGSSSLIFSLFIAPFLLIQCGSSGHSCLHSYLILCLLYRLRQKTHKVNILNPKVTCYS